MQQPQPASQEVPTTKTPFDESSPTKTNTSPVKPFDEAVDDGFTEAWGEDDPDRMYVLSSMMTSQLAKEEQDKRDMTLSFLQVPPPKQIAAAYYGQPPQQVAAVNMTLDSIQEKATVAETPRDTSVASNLTPSTADVQNNSGNEEDCNLLALTTIIHQ